MRPPRIVVCILLAALVAVAPACGGGSSPATGVQPPNQVLVADFTFLPSTLTVKVGTAVTWKFDQPEAPHNVVALTVPVLFNSGTPRGKGAFTFTFTQPGTYPYVCQVHPNMHGTIVVTP